MHPSLERKKEAQTLISFLEMWFLSIDVVLNVYTFLLWVKLRRKRRLKPLIFLFLKFWPGNFFKSGLVVDLLGLSMGTFHFILYMVLMC